ncbi:MAG: outer membrane lipoprotein chaperone LolA [Deltaproteobacteria bacterium]|nr:outer membrane lipoprotein chaperone LolA [Deltaproteobacteria bacterium]
MNLKEDGVRKFSLLDAIDVNVTDNRQVIPAKAGIQLFRTFLDSRWSLPRALTRGGSDRVAAFIVFPFFLFFIFLNSVAIGMTAQTVLTEIQNQYEKTADFEANFAQEYIGKVMRQSQKGEGKVFFKKKGMMRWDYRVPNQKIISDGQTLWFYQPEENQVLISPADKMIKEFGFLVGEGDLRRDFNLIHINHSPSGKEDHFVVELAPKDSHPAVSKLSLAVDRKTYFVIQVDVFDGLGNVTRTRFTDIRTNTNLTGSFFQFKVPPGTEIIKMQDSSSPSSGGKKPK